MISNIFNTSNYLLIRTTCITFCVILKITLRSIQQIISLKMKIIFFSQSKSNTYRKRFKFNPNWITPNLLSNFFSSSPYKIIKFKDGAEKVLLTFKTAKLRIKTINLIQPSFDLIQYLLLEKAQPRFDTTQLWFDTTHFLFDTSDFWCNPVRI